MEHRKVIMPELGVAHLYCDKQRPQLPFVAVLTYVKYRCTKGNNARFFFFLYLFITEEASHSRLLTRLVCEVTNTHFASKETCGVIVNIHVH